MADKILERSEIAQKDKWALEDLYESVAAWEQDLESFRNLVKTIPDYKGKLSTNPNALLAYMRLNDEMSVLCDNLANYAQRKTMKIRGFPKIRRLLQRLCLRLPKRENFPILTRRSGFLCLMRRWRNFTARARNWNCIAVILQNCAKLLDKAIDLDKDTFTQIAALRSSNGQNKLNDTATAIENVNAKINLAFEQYPDLKAHQEIQDAMQQNSYLQREITAAREVYNDTVNQWNTAVYEWPAKQIVAAKRGYTTRVPFITTSEIKQAARGTFF